MPTFAIEPCRCDTCGDPIISPNEGTIEYRWAPNEGPEKRRVDFRIVHNGNVNEGSCQIHGQRGGDIGFVDLSDGRALPYLMSVQSTDPSWSETVLRLLVPKYEDARAHLEKARADDWGVELSKLSQQKLEAVIKAFTH